MKNAFARKMIVRSLNDMGIDLTEYRFDETGHKFYTVND